VQLGPVSQARGVRLLALDEIDSTNDEAKRLVAEGERGPIWIVARRQSKGRGRLGREWVSPAGNLHASLVVSGFGPAHVAPQLGFVAGVAAIAALRAAAGARARFALKWPNDLLLDGAKLGGILLEGVAAPIGAARAPSEMVAIVGIGVNCASAPAGLSFEARALTALGPEAPTAERLFANLSDAVAQTLDLWREGAGFARLRECWLESAAGRGETIRIALARETIEGRFDSLDAMGRLVLVTQDGPRTIEAGDVLLARQARGADEKAESRP